MILRRRIAFIMILAVMAAACHTNVTKAHKTSGEADPQSKEKTSAPVSMSFSKSSYADSDTITFSILNKTDADVNIALRCGRFLEMSYQESVNGSWSENKELPYMMLKCATRMYAITPHEKYVTTWPSSLFKSKGSFRLLISFGFGPENTNQTITTVPFEIR